jgi:choline dehydrogenase-like flavoprotein
MSDSAHRDPVLSFTYLALSSPGLGPMLLTESLRKINTGAGDRKLEHLHNVVTGMPAIAGFLPRFLYRRMIVSRRLWGLPLRSRAQRYALHCHAEHAPNVSFRIRLSNERDALGLHKISLGLRFGAADTGSVVRTHELLHEWLRSTKFGELVWHMPAEDREAAVLAPAGDGVHRIGSARMAATACHGGVDRNGRVFGCASHFLAASAVFPTSGQANPTLCVVAPGVRQARLIAGEMAAAVEAA